MYWRCPVSMSMCQSIFVLIRITLKQERKKVIPSKETRSRSEVCKGFRKRV